MMNQVQTEAQLAAAERLGLQFVRLAVDKWHAAAALAYWQAVDAGKTPEPPRRDNQLFEVIRREFAPR
jgi:hypothetical protein